MRSVAVRWRYADIDNALRNWQGKVLEHHSQIRGERIMRRVGGRWKNRGLSDAVLEWRAAQVMEVKAKLAMARGEAKMRNVALRIKNREVAAGLIAWQMNFRENRNEARQQRVCRRIAGRWRNREASDCILNWAKRAKSATQAMWKERGIKLQQEVEELRHALELLAKDGGLDQRSVMRNVAKQRIKIKAWTGLDF